MNIFTILFLEFAVFALLLASYYIGAFLMRGGHYARALPWLRWNYRVSRIVRSWRGPVSINLCACYLGLGEIEKAIPYGEEAVRETSRRGHSAALRCLAKANLAQALLLLGEFERSEKLFDEVLAVSSPRKRLHASIECCAAGVYLNSGRFEDAVSLLDRALQSPKLHTDWRVVGEYYLSSCHFFRGNLTDALTVSRRAMERTTQNPTVHDTACAIYLMHQVEAGNIPEAMKIEAMLVPRLTEMPPFVRATTFCAIGRLALVNGDLDRARHYAELAYPLRPSPNAQANALLIQAEVFAARQNAARAEALCEEILRLNAIDFYKERASDLRRRLRPDTPQAVVTEQTAYITQPNSSG